MHAQVQGINPQEEDKLPKFHNVMGRSQHKLTHSTVIKHF